MSAEEAPFSEVVGAFLMEAAEKDWDHVQRIYGYLALCAYGLMRPGEVLCWAKVAIMEEKHHRRRVQEARYYARVTERFLFAPTSPSELSRRAYEGATNPRQPLANKPPKRGEVRIRWYPDLQATREWPAGYEKLWVDIPLDEEGSIDLRPVMKLWGMENCYVLDRNRAPGERQLHTQPVERLALLSVAVLLGDLGSDSAEIWVIEMPTPITQAARKARTRAKEGLSFIVKHPIIALRALLYAVWCTVWMLCALSLFTLRDSLVHLSQWFLLPSLALVAQVCQRACIASRSLATTCKAWIVAILEYLFLSGEEIEELEESRRAMIRASLPLDVVCEDAVEER